MAILQAVRLKGGMADVPMLAKIGARGEPETEQLLAGRVAEGCVVVHCGRYRITPDGRAMLEAALAVERERLDVRTIASIYRAFTPHNWRLKQLAHDWQLRGDEPNDHTDAGYDGQVLKTPGCLHFEAGPLLARLAAELPRLASYPVRLERALGRLRAGDQRFFLHRWWTATTRSGSSSTQTCWEPLGWTR